MNWLELHPRSRSEVYPFNDWLITRHKNMTEEIEPFERPGIRPGGYYEVKKFYRTKILTLTEASEYSGIESRELIELGASGKATLCIRIPKAKVMLWVASREYQSIREPGQDSEFIKIFSLFERINRTHQLCPDREKTEWVNLSPEDCFKILSAGIHRQAYFESGWSLTDHLLFESTYPKYSFEKKEDNYLNYISPISLIFISYTKDDAQFVGNNYRHKPDEIYEIEIKKEELMIPKEELQYLMKMVSKQKAVGDGDSVGCNADLDSENDDVKGGVDNCLLVANANQLGADPNGTRNASDTGNVNDGELDLSDKYPLVSNSNQLDTESPCKSTLQTSTCKPNNSLWDRPYDLFFAKHNRAPSASELFGWIEDMAKGGDHVFKYRDIKKESVLSYPYGDSGKSKAVTRKNAQNAIDARKRKAKQSAKEQGIEP